MHGNLSQAQRDRVLAGFKEGKVRFLVATDIAGRGLDVKFITHIFNYNVPHVPEDYIHRIGRTARAGASGKAITFVEPSERAQWQAILRMPGVHALEHRAENVAPVEFQKHARAPQRPQSASRDGGTRPQRDHRRARPAGPFRGGPRGMQRRFGKGIRRA